ncbi:MAG: glutaredoxin family protein [Zoogloeaceae bacterium]|nr:glutaredoxin family protein [Zoogloeaceae bacterium]
MSREWCHLCHDMLALLEPLALELGWSVEVFDVDADPALEAKWNELVPVLLVGDQVLCHYHLDEAVVREYCSSIAHRT